MPFDFLLLVSLFSSKRQLPLSFDSRQKFQQMVVLMAIIFYKITILVIIGQIRVGTWGVVFFFIINWLRSLRLEWGLFGSISFTSNTFFSLTHGYPFDFICKRRPVVVLGLSGHILNSLLTSTYANHTCHLTTIRCLSIVSIAVSAATFRLLFFILLSIILGVVITTFLFRLLLFLKWSFCCIYWLRRNRLLNDNFTFLIRLRFILTFAISLLSIIQIRWVFWGVHCLFHFSDELLSFWRHPGEVMSWRRSWRNGCILNVP